MYLCDFLYDFKNIPISSACSNIICFIRFNYNVLTSAAMSILNSQNSNQFFATLTIILSVA